MLGALVSSSLFAGSADDSILRQADSLYTTGQYLRAAELFAEVADRRRRSEKTQYDFLAAKAYYRGGDLAAARKGFSVLLRRNPPAYVKAVSHFYLGNIEFQQGDYIRAAQEYIKAYEEELNPRRRQVYLESLLPLFAEHLDSEQGERILSRIDDPDLRSEVFCELAFKYFAEQRYQALLDKIDYYLAAPSPPSCQDELAYLQQQCLLRRENVAVVGILAPHSSSLAPYGTSIVEGATLAFEEYEETTGHRIVIHTRDTEGSAIGAAIAVADITSQPLSAILGPLTSAAAPSVISAAICSNIPVISPTAADAGLTSISNNFFQITPGLATMAAQLAWFATQELALDSVAVIYPDDPSGRDASASFIEVAEGSGADLFFVKSFSPTDADFRDIMLELKELVLPDTFDTALFIDDYGDTLETEAVPVQIKAIYIPADESQLELIIPQVNFYKINVTFLGGESWGTERIISLPELETRDVFFVDDFLNLPDDRKYNYFYNKYQRRFDHPPDRVATRSYEAAILLTEAIREVGVVPEAILKYLQTVDQTPSITGYIKLNRDNENQAANIYWLSAGKIHRQ